MQLQQILGQTITFPKSRRATEKYSPTASINRCQKSVHNFPDYSVQCNLPILAYLPKFKHNWPSMAGVKMDLMVPFSKLDTNLRLKCSKIVAHFLDCPKNALKNTKFRVFWPIFAPNCIF